MINIKQMSIYVEICYMIEHKTDVQYLESVFCHYGNVDIIII